jgi:iron complex transport system ATP-binding protein
METTVRRAEAGSEPAPASGPALLEVNDLSVTYRDGTREPRVAVRDVSFTVAPGELLGLVGPNGSGKTTIIRAATGAVPTLTGRVLTAGTDAKLLTQRERARRVAVVPQEPQLPPAFTALEVVLMGRTPHLRLLEWEGAGDLDAARRAMIATDAWPLADRPVGELSGGERQRVVVARALAQEAPVLLLDEPTAHLDIGHQVAILELMRALCRQEGRAVMAVAHDLTLAAQFCDRLLLLHQGRMVAQGNPAEVLRTEVLEAIYETAVRVFPHPDTGRPVVAPQPDER